MRKVFLAVVLGLGFWLTFLPGCRKETEVVTFVHHDTVYVQPDMCPDTTLPINCYTTQLRSSTRNLFDNGKDTLYLPEVSCIWLGHCSFDKFTPLYRVCISGASDALIPDTAMCRAAGLPLCCPHYDTSLISCVDYSSDSDVPGPDPAPGYPPYNDVGIAYLRVIPLCSQQPERWYNLTIFGATARLSHPDSNSAFSCQMHVQALQSHACTEFQLHNCTLRLIDIPRIADTVTAVWLPQGPPDPILSTPRYIRCCAPDVKNTFTRLSTVQIVLQCD